MINTVLFSAYHLWSPWIFLSRLIYPFAGFWLAWRKKDLRLSIGMHAGTNFLLQAVGIIACRSASGRNAAPGSPGGQP